MVFYAVARGNSIGVFPNWPECKSSVTGFHGAVYKKFLTKDEAEAFVAENSKKDCVMVLTKPARAARNKLESVTQGDGEEGVKGLNRVPDYYVYTDGSCSNNGRPNAAAGIGIFFGENDPRNVSRRVEGKQSNNTAELTAILDTYPVVKLDLQNGKNIVIVSDSEYAIRCVTSYGKKCMETNWEKDMPNKDLVKRLYEQYKDASGATFLHIMAHTGKTDIHSAGNDGADRLANLAIGHEQCPYAAETQKIFLNVPFVQKDVAKQLGALWFPSKKKWYIHTSCPNKEQLIEMFGR